MSLEKKLKNFPYIEFYCSKRGVKLTRQQLENSCFKKKNCGECIKCNLD